MPKRRTLSGKLSSVKKTIAKSHRKENGIKVRKMLAAVMDQPGRQVNGNGSKIPDANGAPTVAVETEEFYSSGRTGRRNALPDILGEHAHVTSSDLPARLQALTTTSDQDTVTTKTDTEPGPSSSTPSQ